MRDPASAVSLVIPAHNEERELPATLRAAREALDAVGLPAEIIVVDDASTDATAAIAAAAGARVVSVALRNIGAVRNAGAAAAENPLLVFVDADTRLPAETLHQIVAAVRGGAIGGGARLSWDSPPPWPARVCAWIFLLVWQRMCGWATGCLVFSRSEDFRAVGGFDPVYYAAEERFLTTVLRKRGRFVIVPHPVITSARKLRLFGTLKLIGIAVPALFFGRHRLKRPKGLELLYDAPRETTPTTDIEQETT